MRNVAGFPLIQHSKFSINFVDSSISAFSIKVFLNITDNDPEP